MLSPRLAPLALLFCALLASLLTGPAASASDGAVDPIGVWPLTPEPEVARHFEPPPSPYGAGHRGVDLVGRPGQPVRAALAGTVAYAGLLAGRGVVVVSHGRTRTTYEPVESRVAVGDPVSAGDRIGRLQPGASHCLPRTCLHWGWLEGDRYLDPLRLVGSRPIRLLPLWREHPVPAPLAVVSRRLKLEDVLGGMRFAVGPW